MTTSSTPSKRLGTVQLLPTDRRGSDGRGFTRWVWSRPGVGYQSTLPGETPEASSTGYTATTLDEVLRYYRGATYAPLCKRRR